MEGNNKIINNALSELRAKGYELLLKLSNDKIEVPNGISLVPSDKFFIDGEYYIKDINTLLLAISIPTIKTKGVIIKQNTEKSINAVNYIEGKLKLQKQYGLDRVYLSDIEKYPSRYKLRKNNKDFPPCPFGNSYEKLGYDTLEGKYVRLEKKALKKISGN